jgi:hypothetical protein
MAIAPDPAICAPHSGGGGQFTVPDGQRSAQGLDRAARVPHFGAYLGAEQGRSPSFSGGEGVGRHPLRFGQRDIGSFRFVGANKICPDVQCLGEANWVFGLTSETHRFCRVTTRRDQVAASGFRAGSALSFEAAITLAIESTTSSDRQFYRESRP